MHLEGRDVHFQVVDHVVGHLQLLELGVARQALADREQSAPAEAIAAQR